MNDVAKKSIQNLPGRIVASVVAAGKEYVNGDHKIIALKPSTLALQAGELLLIIGPSDFYGLKKLFVNYFLYITDFSLFQFCCVFHI